MAKKVVVFLTVKEVIEELKQYKETDTVRVLGPDHTFCQVTVVGKGGSGMVYMYCE